MKKILEMDLAKTKTKTKKHTKTLNVCTVWPRNFILVIDPAENFKDVHYSVICHKKKTGITETSIMEGCYMN